jgi:hypothetical protein
MNTPHVSDKLPLWVSGDLSENEMQLVQAHLELCPRCGAEARDYAETLSWLHSSPVHTFTQADRDNVRSGVMATLRKTGSPTARRVMPLKGWLLAAASIPIAVVLYNTMGNLVGKNTSGNLTQAAFAPATKNDVSHMETQEMQEVKELQNEPEHLGQGQPLPEKAKYIRPRHPKTILAKNSTVAPESPMVEDSPLPDADFHVDDPNIKIVVAVMTENRALMYQAVRDWKKYSI